MVGADRLGHEEKALAQAGLLNKCVRRRSYTLKLKFEVINFYQSAALVVGTGASKRWASSRYGIPYNTVRKWLSSSRCAALLSDSSGSHCASVKSAAERCYLKRRDAWREALERVEARVLREFTCFRARGLKVSARTVCCWARKFSSEDNDNGASPDLLHSFDSLRARFSFKRTWFSAFLRRHGLSLRRSSNRSCDSAESTVPAAREFHKSLYHFLNKDNRENVRWGRYPCSNRYNFDQVPLPLVCDARRARTVDTKGAKRVWVRQPRGGLDKRQATVHLTLRAEGIQPKPILVFRGLGKRISKAERLCWDPRVSVLFQKKAWVDRAVALEIAEIYAREDAIENDEENLFFCDNLDAQAVPAFRQAMAQKGGGLVWLVPPRKTEYFQPVDAGAGSHLKALVAKHLDMMLENDSVFCEKWCASALSASDIRILLTRLVGQAFQDMCTARQNPFRCYFEKTGCLLTTDGSEDHLVRPEALGDLYSWPATKRRLQVNKELVECFHHAHANRQRACGVFSSRTC